MKNLFVFTLAAIFFATCLHAQPKIDKSEIFDEPLSEGWTKIMLLHNGNTFYIHYGGKKGIEIIVFGKNKKKTATQRIVSNNWNAKRKKLVRISGAYEINNEPVIFLQYYGDIVPVLYRLRLNPSNGALLKEEVVGERPNKFYMRNASYVTDGQNVYVEKDPESDNYAVIAFNGREKDLDEKIKVMHFDGNHKLIGQASFQSPSADFKYLYFISAVVDGNKRVFLSTYGAEAGKKGRSNVFISRLNSGDTLFTTKTLDFTDDFLNTSSDMVYNHGDNSLVMLTNTLSEKKRSKQTYVSFLSYIDPESLDLKSVKLIGDEKINEYVHSVLGLDMDYNFRGLPQKLVLNQDNTVTVLQEEMTYQEVVNAKNNSTMAEYTYMGNIGITEIGTDGNEKNGYVMMKKQLYVGHTGSMYIAGRSKGIWLNDPWAKRSADDNLFMSYEYIHTPKSNYVIFSDNPKNDKKQEDETKRRIASNTDYINTICYTIKDGVAKKSYLFGEPEKKSNTKACYIEASDYDKRTNTYTTVVSEQHGSKYDSRIAWIHFE